MEEIKPKKLGIWHFDKQRERLDKLRIHPRQPLHEVLDMLLDCWDKNNGESRGENE